MSVHFSSKDVQNRLTTLTRISENFSISGLKWGGLKVDGLKVDGLKVDCLLTNNQNQRFTESGGSSKVKVYGNNLSLSLNKNINFLNPLKMNGVQV